MIPTHSKFGFKFLEESENEILSDIELIWDEVKRIVLNIVIILKMTKVCIYEDTLLNILKLISIMICFNNVSETDRKLYV